MYYTVAHFNKFCKETNSDCTLTRGLGLVKTKSDPSRRTRSDGREEEGRAHQIDLRDLYGTELRVEREEARTRSSSER